MTEFEERRVYETMSKEEAKRQGMPNVIKTRWADRNKGTSDNPEVRSRLVAKEIALTGREGISAATRIGISEDIACSIGRMVERGSPNGCR